MWIRLESCHQDCTPVGVYQDFDYYFLNDFCGQVMLLTIHEDVIEEEECCAPSFWFTLEGWEKYGRWFEGVFEPEAREQDEATILVSIIEDCGKFHPLYKDKFQVALAYEEAIWITSEPRWRINSLEDWQKFERELISLTR